MKAHIEGRALTYCITCAKRRTFSLFILSYKGAHSENNPLNFIGCATAAAYFVPHVVLTFLKQPFKRFFKQHKFSVLLSIRVKRNQGNYWAGQLIFQQTIIGLDERISLLHIYQKEYNNGGKIA